MVGEPVYYSFNNLCLGEVFSCFEFTQKRGAAHKDVSNDWISVWGYSVKDRGLIRTIAEILDCFSHYY